jgi:hypothetical protein
MLSWLIGIWLASPALVPILGLLSRVHRVPPVSVPTYDEPDCDAGLNHSVGTLAENLSMLTDRTAMLREWLTQNTKERLRLLGTTGHMIHHSRELCRQSTEAIDAAFARFRDGRLYSDLPAYETEDGHQPSGRD